ncbi:MAG: GAF and ANTAR domain-containing protein [Sciscionella sp.]
MDDDRRALLGALVDGGDDSVLDRICAVAASQLGVTGVGITLLDRPGAGHSGQLVRASDTIAARLEELQLTVGEGPGRQAITDAGPVLVSDLAGRAGARWSAFTPGARSVGVAAVFAFPLQLGAIQLGALECYRDMPGRLSVAQVADGLLLTEMATEAILTQIQGHESGDLGWITDMHTVVHQASGMVMAQLTIGIDAALLRLRGYAFAYELSLVDVASRIVDRTLVMEAE